MLELLTTEQMYKADELTIKGGHAGIELMETAGRTVCDVLQQKYNDAQKLLVLCGGGNNGGDGYVIARILADTGRQIDLLPTSNPERLTGDAALAFNRIGDKVNFLQELPDKPYDVIVDAVFGAGLDRPVEGKLRELFNSINTLECPVISVDLPSGINGNSGQVMGIALKADVTVTFFRQKPGHVLVPGREYCGEVVPTQIGIRPSVLDRIRPTIHLNRPQNWKHRFPVPAISGHKFSRGHCLVVSGPLHMSGAARLSAGAALRSGAGLVTIAGSKEVLTANAASLTSIMLSEAEGPDELLKVLEDDRINTIAIGPGLPPDELTRQKVLSILKLNRRVVLDAGALSSFEGHHDQLVQAISSGAGTTILTPHEGEFRRLFPDINPEMSKVDQALEAARCSKAIVVYKGPDTIVAHPDGSATIANNCPPWLATAGSGDVLTGIIAGLLAQGMPGFSAANAGVWLHGDAATKIGPALISSDLDEGLRRSLSELILELGSDQALQD